MTSTIKSFTFVLFCLASVGGGSVGGFLILFGFTLLLALVLFFAISLEDTNMTH